MNDEVTIVPLLEEGQVIGLTASKLFVGDANDLTCHEVNQHVGKLLAKLGESLSNQEEYEYDGVQGADFTDGVISITATLFIP